MLKIPSALTAIHIRSAFDESGTHMNSGGTCHEGRPRGLSPSMSVYSFDAVSNLRFTNFPPEADLESVPCSRHCM